MSTHPGRLGALDADPREMNGKRKTPLTTAVIAHQKIAAKKNPPDFPVAGMFHSMAPGLTKVRVIPVPAGG